MFKGKTAKNIPPRPWAPPNLPRNLYGGFHPPGADKTLKHMDTHRVSPRPHAGIDRYVKARTKTSRCRKAPGGVSC